MYGPAGCFAMPYKLTHSALAHPHGDYGTGFLINRIGPPNGGFIL